MYYLQIFEVSLSEVEQHKNYSAFITSILLFKSVQKNLEKINK